MNSGVCRGNASFKSCQGILGQWPAVVSDCAAVSFEGDIKVTPSSLCLCSFWKHLSNIVAVIHRPWLPNMATTVPRGLLSVAVFFFILTWPRHLLPYAHRAQTVSHRLIQTFSSRPAESIPDLARTWPGFGQTTHFKTGCYLKWLLHDWTAFWRTRYRCT